MLSGGKNLIQETDVILGYLVRGGANGVHRFAINMDTHSGRRLTRMMCVVSTHQKKDSRTMITVGMATVLDRAQQFRAAFESLMPQVGAIHPYINAGYGEWPTDAGKFAGVTTASEGYYFCCDDDYIYPPDYAETLCAAIDRHPGSICGFAGGVLKDPPIMSYYSDGRIWNRHWRDEQDNDQPVNILMTCLCGWKVGTVEITMNECKVPMAVDIHLALAAQRQRVPMWLCARPVDWLVYQNIPEPETIHGHLRRSSPRQTGLINDYGAPFEVFG